jgi:signal transduction histidine kinase
VAKDGQVRWLCNHARPVWDQGWENVVGIHAAAQDVTVRKEAEEALRQRSEELQARNEELDAFAHTVAHDLQDPLGLMIGFAELLEHDYDKLSEEDLKHGLRTILQTGHKTSSIIRELLMLASLRQDEVELGPLDMSDIVAEAQQRLMDPIERSQAQIILPDRWPSAVGYGPWVEEVWVNYLSNAIKYGGSPPRVELGADFDSNGDSNEPMVRFWIRDNGPGLTQDAQSRLFVPFTQLAQVRAKGYGLGLSIVRRIADRLGGKAGVESPGVPGEGSMFYFLLPPAAWGADG